MFTIRSVRTVLLPALFGVLVPLSARAQERELFTWTGRVDREVRLTVSPARAIASPEASIRSRTRFRVTSAIPQREGWLTIITGLGRGTVNVIQQPTPENGYAAVVQIVDTESGADNYRVTAVWAPLDDPRYGRNSRGRRDDGRYGRDDRYNDRDDRYDDRNNRDDRYNDRNSRDDRYNDRNNRDGRSNPPLLQWSGDVDGEIHLVWRNGAVRIEQDSGAAPQRVRSTVSGGVSRQSAGQIAIAVRDGRGRVDVIQHPTAQNNYTGVIRISDPQSGYGHYSLDATWR